MRLVLVSDSYPPLIGGATRAVQLLAHDLRDRGHAVTVLTVAQDGSPRQEDDAGVGVHRLPALTLRLPLSDDPYRNTPPPYPDPETVWHARRLLRRLQPDVVHSYGWLTYSVATALLGTGVPLLLSARDYGLVCPKRTLLIDGRPCSGPAPGKCFSCAGEHYGQPKGAVAVAGVLGGRALLRRQMKGLQSCSAFVEQVHAEHLGLPPLHVVAPDYRSAGPPGEVDAAALERLPREPFILFVGALRLIKGIEELLAAYESLAAPPPLVLVGTRAPDSPASFPAGVTVLESLGHATVMAAWDRALFGVAPSLLPEPLGNVVHEAMSRGRPVIGTVPGGHGEMITDGQDGLLVPSGDVAALALALARLSHDQDLRERLGAAASRSAERFTRDRVLPLFEQLFAAAAVADERP